MRISRMGFLFEVFFDFFVYLFEGFGAVLVWLAKGCQTQLKDEFNGSHALRNQMVSVVGWGLLFLLVGYLGNWGR